MALDIGTMLFAAAGAEANSILPVTISSSKLVTRGVEMLSMLDASAGNVIITLPDATTHSGVWFFFTRSDTNLANYAEVVGDINLSTSLIMGMPNETLILVSDGNKWIVMGRRSFAFGSIAYTNVTPTTQLNVTSTPQEFTGWDSNFFSTAGRITPDFTQNHIIINKVDNAVQDGYRVQFDIACEFQNNIQLLFALYVDGVSQQRGSAVVGNGGSEVFTTFNISIGVPAPQPKDISIFVSASSGSNTLTINGANLILEKIGG